MNAMTTREDKIKMLPSLCSGTLVEHLGITFKDFNENALVAEMSVTKHHTQPAGLLHGGASVVLAESIASIGSWLVVTDDDVKVVGVEVNANHIKSVKSGIVIGTGTPVRLGKSIHVWSINIQDQNGHLVCLSRCTVSVK